MNEDIRRILTTNSQWKHKVSNREPVKCVEELLAPVAEERKAEIMEIEAAFKKWLDVTGRTSVPAMYPFFAGYDACLDKLKKAILEEREACAKVAESLSVGEMLEGMVGDEIRARGKSGTTTEVGT